MEYICKIDFRTKESSEESRKNGTKFIDIVREQLIKAANEALKTKNEVTIKLNIEITSFNQTL